MRERFILSQVNGRFVVTDSRSAALVIVNSEGQPADNLTEAKYFGMTATEARKLKDSLN